MNWKIELAKELAHRIKVSDENVVGNYLRIMKEVILPVFKDIKQILHDHRIEAKINNNNDELVVEYRSLHYFKMKIDLHEGKLRIEYFYAETSEDVFEPDLKLLNTKDIDLENVTQEFFGLEFLEAFRPLLKLYK
jgi:hypothetical protein